MASTVFRQAEALANVGLALKESVWNVWRRVQVEEGQTKHAPLDSGRERQAGSKQNKRLC